MRRAIFQLASITTIVCACSDDQGPRALGPEAVSQSVGTAGGTLISKDGTLRLDIPPGALTSARTITIDPIPASGLGSVFNGVSVSKAYELGPSGTTFDRPVTVSVRSDQKATVTPTMISVRTQGLFTVENGVRVGLDSTTMTVSGDTVWVAGDLRHFSPVVFENANTTIIDFTVSGVPDKAELKRPFNVLAKAALRDPAMGVVTQLLGGTFSDRSTLIEDLGSAPGSAVGNVIEVSVAYECPSHGTGMHDGVFYVGYENSAFAATDPGKRVNILFDARDREIECVSRTSQLTIEFRGTGGGKVDGGPPQDFTCAGNCQQRLPENSLATLTATPNALSTFDGFSGQCTGSGVFGVMEPLRMEGDRVCIVTFNLKPTHNVTITKTGQGSGTVTGGVQGAGPSNQLDCGEKCVISVPEGAQVELQSTPLIGSRFGSWGPGCFTNTPNAPIIVFTVNGPVNCGVTFPLEKLNIVVAPSSPTIDVGNSQRLNVVITDELGTVTGREVTFLSGNPSVATVDAQGNVTGVSPGLATMVITVGGPGGGTVNTVVNVVQKTFALTIRKSGTGRGTTSIYNFNTGMSSDFCSPDCTGTVTRVPDGSLLHVLADPEAGSILTGFLEDCEPLIASVDGASAVMTGDKNCTVQFDLAAPPGPLSIAFGGLTSKSTGLSVGLSSVSGTVYADYTVQNYPVADSMNIHARLDNAYAAACFRRNLAGTQVRCEIQTDRYDSLGTFSRGIFPNGLRNLSLVAQNQSGTTLATVDQPLTINNQSFFRVTTNNPVGATSNTVRGGEIKITIRPVIFEPVNGDLSVTLPVTPLSGSGTLTLEGGPGADGFDFTANPANSPAAQGRWGFVPKVFDAGGTDITDFFAPFTPLEQNVDMVPPVVPSFFLPSTTAISGGVLILDFPTGPYPAGERIALSRISGGSIAPVHIPNCGSAHVHGTISIRRLSSSVVDGPYDDPRNFENCGHGSIVTESFSNVLWSFGGTITDASPVTTNIQMFEGVNGCDPAGPTLFDDIPILEGSGPGQSPFPQRTFTTNSFSGIFTLNVDGGMANDNVCFRINVRDSAVGPDGQPSNQVNRMLSTELRPFSVP